MVNTSKKPRFRFAPSPTGYLHVGGARTALYNYLLARQLGGDFILRIEDTDLERSTPESIQAILDSMKWLKMEWDEGPYFQTKRFDLYNQYIDQLIKEKKAYPCFCTSQELEAKRALAQKEKRKPMYDRTCYKLSTSDVEKKISSGEKHCIRFHSHDEGSIIINDLVKGRVEIAEKELDDLIIRRTDGSPTYNFTVVIDDMTMGITHVIRGDDHLNNTPRQMQLYQAFGATPPQFAHLPLILGTDKKRLSKRHGATSVMAYYEMGYLPDALINYLARIGWAYKDQEVFTRQDLIEKFSIESVSKAAGVFNPEKLLWLNGLYIRESKPEDLAKLLPHYLEKRGIISNDTSLFVELVKISQEKSKTLEEMADLVDFAFKETRPDEALQNKFLGKENKPHLKLVYDRLEKLENFDIAGITNVFTTLVQETGLKLGQIAQPVRVALSGKNISAGIYEIIRILGKKTCLARISKYLE